MARSEGVHSTEESGVCSSIPVKRETATDDWLLSVALLYTLVFFSLSRRRVPIELFSMIYFLLDHGYRISLSFI